MDFEQNIVAIVLFGNLFLLLNGTGCLSDCLDKMAERVKEWLIERYPVWVLLIELVLICVVFVGIFGAQCFALENLLELFGVKRWILSIYF